MVCRLVIADSIFALFLQPFEGFSPRLIAKRRIELLKEGGSRDGDSVVATEKTTVPAVKSKFVSCDEVLTVAVERPIIVPKKSAKQSGSKLIVQKPKRISIKNDVLPKSGKQFHLDCTFRNFGLSSKSEAEQPKAQPKKAKGTLKSKSPSSSSPFTPFTPSLVSVVCPVEPPSKMIRKKEKKRTAVKAPQLPHQPSITDSSTTDKEIVKDIKKVVSEISAKKKKKSQKKSPSKTPKTKASLKEFELSIPIPGKDTPCSISSVSSTELPSFMTENDNHQPSISAPFSPRLEPDLNSSKSPAYRCPSAGTSMQMFSPASPSSTTSSHSSSSSLRKSVIKKNMVSMYADFVATKSDVRPKIVSEKIQKLLKAQWEDRLKKQDGEPHSDVMSPDDQRALTQDTEPTEPKRNTDKPQLASGSSSSYVTYLPEEKGSSSQKSTTSILRKARLQFNKKTLNSLRDPTNLQEIMFSDNDQQHTPVHPLISPSLAYLAKPSPQTHFQPKPSPQVKTASEPPRTKTKKLKKKVKKVSVLPVVKELPPVTVPDVEDKDPQRNGKSVGRPGSITCAICNVTKYYSHKQRRHGQFSCEPCSKFFGRFLRSPKLYYCSNNGEF